jgi:hypothetical protein
MPSSYEGLFPSGFPTKILYKFLIFPIAVHSHINSWFQKRIEFKGAGSRNKSWNSIQQEDGGLDVRFTDVTTWMQR